MALKITIDPGHGKNGNKSPNNIKYIEGTQMWILANKLKAALEKYGFEVLTTRPNITDNPSLSERGKMAGNNDCSLFLSLHSNAPGKSADGTYNKKVTGTIVYYSMTDSKNKTLADTLGKKVSEIMRHNYRGSQTKQYPNKPGVDYYGVIRAAAQSGCKCAMLIEHGFHTNINDSNFLLVDTNLEKIASAEAEIIANYFGQKALTEANKPVEAENQNAGTKTLYRVQVGAYSVKSNADAMMKKLKAAGYDAFITTSSGEGVQQAEAKPALKSIDEIAKEVIKGLWGNGAARKEKLSAAGYDYTAVQKKVNELLK